VGETSEVHDENAEEATTVASLRRRYEEGGLRLESELISEAIDLLFPDFSCLRCGYKEFLVGPTLGIQSFRPEKKFVPQSRTEIVCARCGMIEGHSAIALLATLLDIPLEGD
jgi:predicted nucleic-acid-binding Zn-ribbon protein